MKLNLKKLILWASTAWGIIMLVVGLFASFSIGANDTITSLIGFFMIFILPIIASIAARWVPMVSGFALLASVILVLIGFYVSGGMIDVLHVLARVYLWFHTLFGIMFLALAMQSNRIVGGERG